MRKLVLPVLAVIFSVHSRLDAQQHSEKFDFKYGKATKEDFVLPADAIEKDADAYVICDKGFTEFNGNTKGWFTLKFTRKVRVKINNANGVDAADFKIYLYKSGSAVEKVISLKAVAYNVEGDKVVETSLKNDQVFEDKYSKNVQIKKFSVPGVKAGSLVDVTYSIESDFIENLQPWTFQGEYPRYWSEYEADLPFFFNYVTLTQGYQPFYQKYMTQQRKDFRITIPGSGSVFDEGGRSQAVTESANVEYHTWVMKNVPALKPEAFTSSISNHIAKVEFQLSAYRFEGQPYQDRMAQWPQVVKEYNASENFGLTLYKNNGWLDDELKPVLAGASGNTEKAKRIYAHLRDKYSCTGGGEFLTSNLKSVQKLKSGNVGDINLMLVAMLNHEEIAAHPVILSTRDNGWTNEVYPLMDRYNYVVAQATIDGKLIYLDATEPGLPFGVLPAQCYNGHARLMHELGEPVFFYTDSITEKKTSTFLLQLDEKGEWVGGFSSSLGTYESVALRQKIKDKGLKDERESIVKAVPSEFTITEPGFENLDSADKNIVVRYSLTPIIDKEEDVIYLNPMLTEAYKDNPFSSAIRKYPVEMPYGMNEVFVANIQIPEGYVVDEKPKGLRVNLYEADGMFEYLISTDEHNIMLRSKLVVNRTIFEPDEYEVLRDFFGHVVKKQAETIVLKKKK